MKKYAPVITIAVTLALAFVLDRTLVAARNVAVARVSVAGYQTIALLADLLFAGCILGLGWQLARGAYRGPWAAACLVAGLAVALLPMPPFWGLGAGLPASMVPLLRASPHSFAGQAGAALAVVGLAGLVMPVSHGLPRLPDPAAANDRSGRKVSRDEFWAEVDRLEEEKGAE